MNQSVVSYVEEKIKELLAAPSCCAEANEAAKAWLDAVGTDKEAEAGKNLIAELEEDIMPIEGLIGFLHSDAAAGVFGKEQAAAMLSHAEDIQAEGEKYCDCPACAAAKAILDKKEELLNS